MAAKIFSRIVLTVAFVAAIVVTMYPVVTHLQADAHTTALAVAYEEETHAEDEAVTSQEVAQAREYNAHLDSNLITDPWGQEPPETGGAYETYMGLLHSSDVMATISIPSVAIHQPIFHGSSEASLSRGVGHMYGTSLPVGGQSTHTVLAGHNQHELQTFFSNLVNVNIGDRIDINVAGETLTYQIDSMTHVEPSDLEQIQPVAGQDLVTLVTCDNPFDDGPNNKYRLLVRAERVMDTSGSPEVKATWIETTVESMQPWMWTRVAISAVTLLLLCGFIVSWIRQGRRAQ